MSFHQFRIVDGIPLYRIRYNLKSEVSLSLLTLVGVYGVRERKWSTVGWPWPQSPEWRRQGQETTSC